MASTYSTNLAVELQANGENSGTWGTIANKDMGLLLEQAISSYVVQAFNTDADVTLTMANGLDGNSNAAQPIYTPGTAATPVSARNMFIECTGAITGNKNLIVPSNKKLYIIYNNTTGGYSITVKVSGQTGVAVPNGKKMILVSNGTDIVNAENYIASLSVGALTSDRVPYAGTAGLLQDSANLTFNGTTLTANTIGAFTLGGTVAGGGNQLNNVIIGTTTPLAGAFTTLSATGSATVSNTFPKMILKRSNSAAAYGSLDFVGSDDTVDWQIATNHAIGSQGFEINGADGSSNFLFLAPTTGYLKVIGVYSQTSGSAANVVVDSNGNVMRSTSVLSKKNLRDDLTLAEARVISLGNRALRYTMKDSSDETEYLGYGAELVAEKDSRMVTFDKAGNPDGIQYPAYAVPHGMILDDHESRIAALEARLAALEAK